METQNKRLLGQFYTIANPFNHNAFAKWWKCVEKDAGKNSEICEPFAGGNNIISLINELGYIDNKWASYDIDPKESMVGPAPVVRDTIADFPTGYKISITNPPYLAKNSATRRGLPFPETTYEDLYQVALEKMLENNRWVAAIIPASFVNAGTLQDRLQVFIELNCRMFADTECPVALTLFAPETQKDFEVYRGEMPLGKYSKIKETLQKPKRVLPWKFNSKFGEIGLKAIDNSREASIQFVPGKEIDPDDVKASSRSITRIKCPHDLSAGNIIRKANAILAKYRSETCDVLLTPFKGLRDDGQYRRRLDFANAKTILDLACHD